MSKKLAAQIKSADDSKRLVDLLCERVLLPDFNSGVLMGKIETGGQLASIYAGNLERLVKPEEWDSASLRVITWQEDLDISSSSIDPLDKILEDNPRFPSVGVVLDLLGIEAADTYRYGLEDIENFHQAYNKFPDERTEKGWNKTTCDRAVSLVVNVISKHLKDPEGMKGAYLEHMNALRTVSVERRRMLKCEDKRKEAKMLGIWLPMQEDKPKWFSDPRTKDFAVEFERLAAETMVKMKALRSILQYIPRRKFTSDTVSDVRDNMERMRAYLKAH